MRKTNLIKAIMLGLCLTAIPTGTAFAQLAVSPAPAVVGEGQSGEQEILYKKQTEIDQYLMVDHAKEIEEKGFMINYTSVVSNYIEIGISPYTDESAEFIYGIFGKDNVKVIEFDQSIMYASGVNTTDSVAVDGAADVQTVKDEMQANLEDINTATTEEGKVYKTSDVQIQIESTSEEGAPDAVVPDAANPEVIYETLSIDDAQDATDIQTVSAAVDTESVKRGASEEQNGVPAPIMILAIAGGAALIGGAFLTSSKKKSTK